MAFCTAADVESFALIDFNSALETHLTNELIPLVEDVIREYLGYDVDYATHTETFSGNQTKELFLAQRPVIAVSSVVEDGNTCLLYTSPSPRDRTRSRMPSSA